MFVTTDNARISLLMWCGPLMPLLLVVQHPGSGWWYPETGAGRS